jgi:hypothetical protein
MRGIVRHNPESACLHEEEAQKVGLALPVLERSGLLVAQVLVAARLGSFGSCDRI